ncbi:Telomere maintenance component 1 [Hibiscus syriacus]|uniref:CST complex subunit CTC1 n=1 Tax=Hibiscus syriacus TaxID=106335 RepID=A0A6A2YI53_HIBSY|nr:CST complex subunit CTC1-like [Hibiscus syriacus]KAE8675887.1 Telomere maintenance component 1 [Hibiscus syriacus]
MQDVKILTLSDLLSYGRSHTGSSTPGPPIIFDQNPQRPPGSSTSNPNQELEPLAQLDYPAILVGTLRLPTLTLSCPHKNCLEFSDDSDAVCCDIVGFDLRAIGKKIHVLTWNFITSDHLSSGFLEIFKWDLSDSSHGLSRCSSMIIDSSPLVSNSIEHVPRASNAKSYRIHGVIGAVSPVSVVPCSVEDSSSSKSMNLRGFQVRVMTCECKLCRYEESVSVLFGAADCHFFTVPVYVYFCGPAWCWHPVLMKLIEKVVTISGLMKKLTMMGKQDSVLMLVTAENTVLHLPRLWKKIKVVRDSYVGTVKNVYMKGLVVELDKEVWLLLTNQSLMPPHGLRIGAVISMRNVHFVDPQFSWAKFLVLGTCSNTSIIVKSFSPLKTRCLIVSHSQSRLGDFIETLGFPTRLWVLLLVSCFQKTFSGVFSINKILGSSHNEGLVQRFANSHLNSSVFRARHGVLMEFCKHESCCSATDPYHGNLKLVVPISSFIYHCEILWINALLPSDNNLPVSCGGKYYQRSKRKSFQSEDLGIILVGMLKISSSSGRLQLVDMTGSIDVIIPDLPSFWDPNSIFEVIDYFLIAEGMPESDHPGLSGDDLLLPRSIFQGFPSARKPNLKIFVCFHLRNATCRNRLIYPYVASEDELNDTKSGIFHLIYITRKFRSQSHSKKLEISVFAEAIVMPWYLFLTAKDGSIHQEKVLIDCTIGNPTDHSSSKRQKTSCSSSQSGPGFKNNFCNVCFEKGTFLRETCGHQSCMGTNFSHEIPCLATIQGVNNFFFTSFGTLYRIKTNAKAKVCKGSAKKIFLAFASESDFKYQLLQIGGFYLMKHHKEGSLCNIKDSGLECAKVLVTSGTYLRKLSFSSEILTADKSMHDSSVSDIHLHVSSSLTGLFESDTKELETGQNAPDANLGNSGLLDHSCLFPARMFTSVCGDIIAVHSFDQGSDMCSSREHYGDLRQYGFCAGAKNCCIHVSVANQTVKVFEFFNQYLFPTGFGPGINATFHRILDLRPRVPSTLLLTSESSIVIDPIRAFNETHSSDGNLKLFRCRVVAVHLLVLEKNNRKCDDLKSNMQSRPLGVDIPLACFILDDGSRSWCCWADAKRAATLLRLKECPLSGCEASGYKKRWIGVQNTDRTSTMHHLQRILEKHERITVKSARSVFDPINQDFTVTVGSGRELTGLDDDFHLLASIIFNASINTLWTVVTEVMDSNAVNLLKEHLVEMQMPMPSMENLWAAEVCFVNQRTEAREMLQNNL